MLLLTSVNDRLQVITSAAATVDVHASWVDTSAGVITPGRTNTNISTATTTSVAGAAAASTQRNVKTLHVRNRHATLACDITVQHTDGAITSQLYKTTLLAGGSLEYTDQAGFVKKGALVGNVPQVYTLVGPASGTFTTPVGALYLEVEMVGGGGGGGGGSSTATAGNGGDTTFGAGLTAHGGQGGTQADDSFVGNAIGGTATGGDVNVKGADGSNNPHFGVADIYNSNDDTTEDGGDAAGGAGGSSFFGGAGRGNYGAAGGNASAGSGSGGGGGGVNDHIGGARGGQGGGAGGYVRKLITSPAASYAVTVGGGGTGASGGGSAGVNGGNGGSGQVIVTAYFQ